MTLSNDIRRGINVSTISEQVIVDEKLIEIYRSAIDTVYSKWEASRKNALENLILRGAATSAHLAICDAVLDALNEITESIDKEAMELKKNIDLKKEDAE